MYSTIVNGEAGLPDLYSEIKVGQAGKGYAGKRIFRRISNQPTGRMDLCCRHTMWVENKLR